MKYVLLIHSNPQPWGHPTGHYLAEFQALPAEQRERLDRDFEQFLGELAENGEWGREPTRCRPSPSRPW